MATNKTKANQKWSLVAVNNIESLLILITFFSIPLSQKLNLEYFNFSISLPAEFLIITLSSWTLIKLITQKISLKVITHPLSIILLIDTLWLLFTSFTSVDLAVSLKRTFMRMHFILFGYVMLFSWFSNLKNIPRPFFLYTLGIIPIVFLSISRLSIFGFEQGYSTIISQPFYDDHTIYAACLAFILPLIIILTIKARYFKIIKSQSVYISVAIFVICCSGILFSFSRAAWITSVLSIVILIILQFKLTLKSYFIGFVLLLSGIIFSQRYIQKHVVNNTYKSSDYNFGGQLISSFNISTDVSNRERINRWICAYKMFKEKPIAGYGPGTYQFNYGKFQSDEYRTRISTFNGDRGNAHSEYFTYLSESGLIGLISFVTLILATIYFGIKNSLSTERHIKWINDAVLTAFVAYCIHGAVNSFLDQEKMAPLFFGAIALIGAIDVFHVRRETTVQN